MKKVISLYSDTFACGQYRVIQPIRGMQKIIQDDFEFKLMEFPKVDTFPQNFYGKINGIKGGPPMHRMNIIDLFNELNQHDIIIFQRVANPQLVKIMKELKASGRTVITEIDDNLLDIEQKNPAKTVWYYNSEATLAFEESLRVSDCVWVSTPELKKLYSKYNNNIQVFLNAIDINERFVEENHQRKFFPADKTIVMWSGSTSHIESLQIIAKNIKQVFDARPDAIFALCGNKEFMDFFNIDEKQKLYVPHVPVENFFVIPSIADIGLAPVHQNIFNDGKSELKCLEYGVWGIPTVCSPVAPYKRFNEVSGGGNLIAKGNEKRNWCDNIAKLIDNPELRKELGQKSLKTINEQYSLSLWAQKRYEFLKENYLK